MWFLESGVSFNYISHKDWFYTYVQEDFRYVTICNGQIYKIFGKGIIC